MATEIPAPPGLWLHFREGTRVHVEPVVGLALTTGGSVEPLTARGAPWDWPPPVLTLSSSVAEVW